MYEFLPNSQFYPVFLINNILFRFRCLAINNNITKAAESFLMIDMFCKSAFSCLSCGLMNIIISVPPLAVKISSEGGPFAAGKDYYVR